MTPQQAKYLFGAKNNPDERISKGRMLADRIEQAAASVRLAGLFPDTVILPLDLRADLFRTTEWLRFKGMKVVFAVVKKGDHAVRIGGLGLLEVETEGGFDVHFGLNDG